MEIATRGPSSTEFCCEGLGARQVNKGVAGGASGLKGGYFQEGEEHMFVCPWEWSSREG